VQINFRPQRPFTPNWPALISNLVGLGGLGSLAAQQLIIPLHAPNTPLFNESGGRGLLALEWPAPWPGVSCGYVGGLGSDNLREQFPRILEAARSVPKNYQAPLWQMPIWIDLQGKVPNEENRLFDLTKVRACLEESKPFVVSGLSCCVPP
jgi:hypothetical protein